MTVNEYTVTGIMRFSPNHPVEAIAEALMAGAANREQNAAISVDLGSSAVEIECIVEGSDVIEGLAEGKLIIHDICESAEWPVSLEDHRPRASEWRLVDEAAQPLAV